MWMVPRAVTVVAGAGEGATDLNAFDHALLDAGIANLNFLRVTSIFPQGARVVPMRPFVPGTLMPAVYARISRHTPGERIAAAVGVGIGEEGYGVIMEHSHTGTAENAEEIVRKMVADAMAARGLHLREIVIGAKDHVVQRMGCVVAAVLFWPD
ncbi:MAG: arginine decarboxylase, pyruvoyl-dependent [Armatimonadota bacterium]|nr:arginine decarboxylase, pyruvoyl-dependent [Armatimonadota bacterium]MDR7421685.1 arginine decarboxylase, pyruvoyl-dependent [Armatimonadota bacterium]MDR7454598.1 arginine decarboxylase, pyruvoyl-dependent [Armatimonadota bacterium]MDR7456530.1 arginine decarboxylase, pyruvoyl-dependent [Armatimonadota bacterium]MDR7495843.1 arginine decarboxylase, pyruvoyl-dependent [Armatimonadota bacterium]